MYVHKHHIILHDYCVYTYMHVHMQFTITLQNEREVHGSLLILDIKTFYFDVHIAVLCEMINCHNIIIR